MSLIACMMNYAIQFIGIPYKWGGSSPMEGYDCSGFVQEILSSVGLDPKYDQNAQSLFDSLSKKFEKVSEIQEGDILFFGKDSKNITHVSIAIGRQNQMIESAGGG